MTSVVLRYDDFSEFTDTALERTLLQIVAEHGARVVVSVVPFAPETNWAPRGPIRLRPLSQEKAALLRECL